MQVILIEEVSTLGSIGDQVKVKDGYARNFLIPKKLAVVANPKNKRRFEHQKRVIAHKAAKAREDDQATLGRLKGLELEIPRRVGEQDKLYGSVTALDIEAALEARGVKLDRRKIMLPEPIKQVGVFDVPVRLRQEMETTLKVAVVVED